MKEEPFSVLFLFSEKWHLFSWTMDIVCIAQNKTKDSKKSIRPFPLTYHEAENMLTNIFASCIVILTIPS